MKYYFKWSEFVTIRIENECFLMHLVLIRLQYNEWMQNVN